MAFHHFRAMTPPLAALIMTGGCAVQGPFPSLAPRAVENLPMEEPIREMPAVPSDPRLLARVAELLVQARQGDAAFEAARPAAAAAAAGAGAAGSDSWVEAQEAISALEAARAPTVIALAELDRLSVAQAAASTNAGDFETLLAAVESAEALARSQHERIDRLRAALSAL